MTTRPKPHVHGRDHEHGGADPTRIHWEDVGGSGGGGGIQFDIVPQDGGFLFLRTTGATSYPGFSGDGIVLAATNDIDVESSDVVNINGAVGVAVSARGDGGITISTQGLGNLSLEAGVDSGIDIYVHSPALLTLIGLPTSNPGGGNTVWRDSGGYLRIG